MSKKTSLISLSLPALLAVLLHAAGTYKVVARYPIPGNGGFDYVTLDECARRLYAAHGTQVNVLDADSGKQVGVIPDTPGVHGVAIATGLHHGFVSIGAENQVLMFDPATLKPIKKIDTGPGPDGIYFDPGSRRVFTNNHGTHDITAIDAATGKVVGTVKVDGDGEQPVLAGGLVYVNSEDTDEVVIFDPKTLAVTKRFPIGVAKTPTGLAYDAKHKRLFIACREEPKLVVMDAASGKVVASFPIAGGADWAHFDPASRQVFVSTGEGLLNVFHQKSADQYEDAGAVKTQPSAKTMAFDAKTNKIFLTALEYEPAAATAAEPGKRPRRKIKPDSGVLLVVDR